MADILQKMLAEGMRSLTAGAFSAFAAGGKVTGGKVIEDQPAGSNNAREITRMLAGGRGGGMLASATSSANAINISRASSTQLAKEIAQEGKKEGGNLLNQLKKTVNPVFEGGRRLLGSAAQLAGDNDPGKGGIPAWMKNALGGGTETRKRMAAIKLGEQSQKLGLTTKDGAFRGFSGIIPSPEIPTTPSTGFMSAATTGKTAMGDLAGMAGEVAGTIGSAVGMGAALLSVTELMKSFGESLVEGNRELAKWSGGYANSLARYDITKIQLEQRTALATEGTGGTLTDSVTSLAEEFQPIAEDLKSLANIGGLVVVDIARVLTLILSILDELGGPALRAIEKFLGSGNASDKLPIADLLNFLKVGANDQTRRREFRPHHDKPGSLGDVRDTVRDGVISGIPGIGAAYQLAKTAKGWMDTAAEDQ